MGEQSDSAAFLFFKPQKNKTMENLNYYYRIVEEALAKLGLDPQDARLKNPGQWRLSKGKIPVWITVFYREKEKSAYFQVDAPVMKVPQTNRENFALELLSINDRLFGVAFCIYKGNVHLKTLRETEGLDVSEVSSMILRIANYADQYDDILLQKYPDRQPIGFFAG